MPLAYLPIQAQRDGEHRARKLVGSSRPAWCDKVPALADARVTLLSSAAVRQPDQPPFVQPEDTSYRRFPSDPAVPLVIDHRSPVGTDAKRELEIVLPRVALAALAAEGMVGSVAPAAFSFVGGCRLHTQIEAELGPALADELTALGTDLAILAPY